MYDKSRKGCTRQYKAWSRLLVLVFVLLLTCKGCSHCSSVTRQAWTGKDLMASDDEVLITSASFIVMIHFSKRKVAENVDGG